MIHYADSDAEALEVCRSIKALGRNAFAIKADFRTHNSPFQVAAAVEGAFSSLDILVNNASVYSDAGSVTGSHDLFSETPQDWDLALNVNARAPFFLIQALAPLLTKSPQANIINILDRSVSKPFLSRASHTVSKSALLSVTKLAANTLPPNIRVTALELGAILPPDNMPAADRSKLHWGKVEEVVAAIQDLCSTPTAPQHIRIGPDE
jgi:NAD(P)-dependent dehydrogenase (short-subunit alcohol dehydrogenase family)